MPPRLDAIFWLSRAARFRRWLGAIGSRHLLQHTIKVGGITRIRAKLTSSLKEPLELLRVIRFCGWFTRHGGAVSSVGPDSLTLDNDKHAPV
jgi:hypothetical protein